MDKETVRWIFLLIFLAVQFFHYRNEIKQLKTYIEQVDKELYEVQKWMWRKQDKDGMG